MEEKRYYEMGVEEIVRKGEEKIKDGELQATTINLPQIIRLVLTDIKERNQKLNWQKLSRRVIEHGFSIMEHEYGKTIREIGELRKKLRYAKMKRIRNYTMDTKICVDGVDKMARKSIKIRKEIFAAISTVATTLGLEVSSLIRLCIYHSLITSRDLPDEVIEASKKEIEKFIYDLEETRNILEKFEQGEEEWSKKIEEVERQRKDIISRLRGNRIELDNSTKEVM